MEDWELARAAQEAEDEEATEFTRRKRRMEDFRYDEHQEKYWDTTTGILLGDKSVNGAIPRDDWPTKAAGKKGALKPYQPAVAINDVDTGLTVEGSTWWPGKGQFIQDHVITDRGLLPTLGAITYNSYAPPDHGRLRTDRSPDRWIEHVMKLWPDPIEHQHFFDFAAHMVQRPEQKVNHGVVMAGAQGIGKDTALLPLRRGVGEWNCAEIKPDAISKPYNGYVKSVLLIINEVRPHDEDHRASSFYNECKTYLAAPPDMLPMEMKYVNVIYVPNVCHVILTTNDPLTMYIPHEDRRLFVMTSPLPDPKENDVFAANYFEDIYEYLADGGSDAVVGWLLNRDILEFNSGAPPAMTSGKKAIIESASQVRRTLADEICEIYVDQVFNSEKPEIIFAKDLADFVNAGDWFDDRLAAIKTLNNKSFHFKMDEQGYGMMRNPHANEWRSGKFRSRMAFYRKDLPRESILKTIHAELERRPMEFKVDKF